MERPCSVTDPAAGALRSGVKRQPGERVQLPGSVLVLGVGEGGGVAMCVGPGGGGLQPSGSHGNAGVSSPAQVQPSKDY